MPDELVFDDLSVVSDTVVQGGVTPNPIGATPISSILADVNGDGRLDFLHAPGDWPTGKILTKPHLWLQQTDGSFQSVVVDDVPSLSFPGQVFVKDFNNDGRKDIYIATLGNELIIPEESTPDALYLQQADGIFALDTRAVLPKNWAHGTSVGDLDGDGWIDVFSTGGSNDPNYIYWGSSNGFRVEEIQGTDLTGPFSYFPPHYRDVLHRNRIQDFDGDGENDLLIGASGFNNSIAPGSDIPVFPTEIIYSYSRDNEVRLALPIPEVSWMDPWAYEINNSQIGDLDGDGDMDLVIAYMNNGGFFHEGNFYGSWEANQFGVEVDPPETNRIIQVLRNDGDRYTDVSEHLPRVTLRDTFGVFEVNILDFNADGHLDLYFDPSNVGETASILLGDGAFGFREPTGAETQYDFRNEAADVNADGVPDFVGAWSEHYDPLAQTYMVMVAGQGEADVWYGTSNDDAVILRYQTEAHGGVGDDHLVGTEAGDRIWGGWNDDLLEGSLGEDHLFGGHGQDVLRGGSGNDILDGGVHDDLLNGGNGIDTVVYTGQQISYTLTLSPTGTTITDRRADGDGTDALIDVEFLEFDTSLVGDPFNLGIFGGPAGLDPVELERFIELYIAYFNRAPDAIGLNFWGTAFANGLTLEEMAALFAPQDETLATYPEGTSNEDFAFSVYKNVLGRDPDLAGFNFWVGQLDAGNFTRDQFILEVLRGVQSGSPDREYLDSKVDLGAYFAVHKGLSDVTDASAAMALYDGSQASITDTVNAIDGFFTDALDPTDGEFLMPLVGVLDDPFLA